MIDKVYFDLFGLLIKYSLCNKLISNKFISVFLLTRFDFYYLLNIILFVNDLFFLHCYFLNYFNLVLKDYRIFIYSEFYLYFNTLKFFYYKVFNKVKDINVINIKNLSIRIDSILFFVLNVYVEYCRIFFLNNFISSTSILKNNSNLGKFFINNSNNRYLLGKSLIINIAFDRYIIYNRYYNYYNIFDCKLYMKFMDSFLILFDNFFNFNFFNFEFLFYIIKICNKEIYIYILYNMYISLLQFPWLFKFKSCSLKNMYILVKDSRENNLYLFLLTILLNLKDVLLNFYSNDLSLFDNYNNYINYIYNYDFIFIDYVSLLFLKYFKNFNLMNFNKIGLDLSYLWEIFIDWYHFDLCLFVDYFDIYLKYYIDFYMMHYFNNILDCDKSVYQYSQVNMLYKYTNIDNYLLFYYSFFFEILLFFFVFLDFNKLLYIFIYYFFMEYFYKVLLSNKLLNQNEWNTQFLLFYYSFNYPGRFKKLYKFFKINSDLLK